VSFVEYSEKHRTRKGRFKRARKLSPFFRSTLTWSGYVVQPLFESPVKIKIMAVVFTFYKPVSRNRLEPYVDDELENFERFYQGETEKAESGFEQEQVSHDEASGIGFYRVVVTVDDEETRRERLR
jgi:hypothetical protein